MAHYEILKRVDLDPSEEDELKEIVKQAKDADGFLHIQIRRQAND
jgi:hypothetical protein